MKITLYGRTSCPFCIMAKNLCEQKNLEYEWIDVHSSPEKCEEIAKKYNHDTVPIIFVDGEFVGGFDDFSARFA